MRKHNLINKKTTTKTNTMTNTFREHLQRAILETCDLWDIWSEWWGDMTRPEKRQWQRRRQRQWEIHLETCDLWDTVYISDNWEPGFMTIFVIWQLIVTLDSLRNSCDVFFTFHFLIVQNPLSQDTAAANWETVLKHISTIFYIKDTQCRKAFVVFIQSSFQIPNINFCHPYTMTSV